jgi:hypothetical protein
VKSVGAVSSFCAGIVTGFVLSPVEPTVGMLLIVMLLGAAAWPVAFVVRAIVHEARGRS